MRNQLRVKEVENHFISYSDGKIYKESNTANRLSIEVKLTKIQHFRVEDYSKPFFENMFDFSH